MDRYLSISIEYRGIKFSFYVKDDEPGIIYDMVDDHNYVRFCTEEEDALLQEIQDTVDTVHIKLLFLAAERWESWQPVLENVLTHAFPESMSEEN